MSNAYLRLVQLGLALSLALGLTLDLSSAVQAQEDYSIEQLLQPCMEGDNDSREQGFVAELQCEQYIRGFLDSYVLLSEGGKSDNVCLPVQNRADEVRWAFMRWAHENYGQRNMPAAQGLMAVTKSKFVCQ